MSQYNTEAWLKSPVGIEKKMLKEEEVSTPVHAASSGSPSIPEPPREYTTLLPKCTGKG